MVIGIDDIQWADAATLNAITVLPRRLASHRILWLLVARSGELAPSAQWAVARLRTENADFLTLTAARSKAVSRDILGGAPDGGLRGSSIELAANRCGW